MIKVNLGSGFVGLEGWLNYDNSIVARFSKIPCLIRFCVRLGILPTGYLNVSWPPVILHDCRKGIPLKDSSVDFIYTSHFLEHLYRYEVFALLKECYRVLKPSGKIRIVLPDIERLVDLYLKRDVMVFHQMITKDIIAPTYADMFVANFFPYEMNAGNMPPLMERIKERFLRRHKWMYNQESFSRILTHLYFIKITQKAFRDSDLEDVRRLDAHEETSFYLEAEPDK